MSKHASVLTLFTIQWWRSGQGNPALLAIHNGGSRSALRTPVHMIGLTKEQIAPCAWPHPDDDERRQVRLRISSQRGKRTLFAVKPVLFFRERKPCCFHALEALKSGVVLCPLRQECAVLGIIAKGV
jgi:hypothetical protein